MERNSKTDFQMRALGFHRRYTVREFGFGMVMEHTHR